MDDLEVNHEINVTPFIDVMLVLLIIFMVAAPLATVDIGVDLPGSTAQPKERPDEAALPDAEVGPDAACRQEAVPREQLAATLDAAPGDKESPHLPARRQGRRLSRRWT
jgi:biopolymer transport protein ExbD